MKPLALPRKVGMCRFVGCQRQKAMRKRHDQTDEACQANSSEAVASGMYLFSIFTCMSVVYNFIPRHLFFVGCALLAYAKIINHLFTNVNSDDNSCFSNACDVVNITGNACEGDYLKHRVATTKAMTPIWCKPNVTPDWCECPSSSDFSDFQKKEKNKV